MQNFQSVGAVVERFEKEVKNGGQQKQKGNFGPFVLFTGVNKYPCP